MKNHSEIQGYGITLIADGAVDESSTQISDRLWFCLSQLQIRNDFYDENFSFPSSFNEELQVLKELSEKWRINESYGCGCIPKTYIYLDIIDEYSSKKKK